MTALTETRDGFTLTLDGRPIALIRPVSGGYRARLAGVDMSELDGYGPEPQEALAKLREHVLEGSGMLERLGQALEVAP